jgi:hypothetical protein
MRFHSVVVPAEINCWITIITAAVNISCMLSNLTGGSGLRMVTGAVIQVILRCLLIGYAWKRPRTQTGKSGIVIVKTTGTSVANTH